MYLCTASQHLLKKTLMLNRLFLFITLLTLLCGCAKVVTPVGGPKDTTPPKLLKEQPENANVNFQDGQIKITFDEYFTLNNPNDNVLISPPMHHAPDYKIKGKSLIIKIKDTLQPNTTYNMVFSNCIQDFNENNKLNYYHYSFSTGSAVDSFKIKGDLRDAQTLEPAVDFFVLLYRDNIDSLPLTSLPSYITKTLSNGHFEFEHIGAGSYKIFALKDINANLLFDLPNESIAFQEALVEAYALLKSDTNERGMVRDTLPGVELLSFIEKDSIPRLQRYENPAQGIYQFPYKGALTSFSAVVSENCPDYFQTMSITADTVTWYMKSMVTDTVTVILTANGHSDTVMLKPYKKLGGGGRGTRASNNELGITFSNLGHKYKPLTLNFSYPVRQVDSFPVVIYAPNDTTVAFFSVADTFVKELPLPFEFTDKHKYTIVIPDSVFSGYNGLTHDTLKTQFTAKTERDYGNLQMNYQLPSDAEGSYIAQLWSGNKLIQKNILTCSQSISYAHLEPGNYRISVIHDRNNNGLWDSGCYREKQQPETVKYFRNGISIRAYWDVEETFTIDF